MPRAATDVMQAILFSAVLDAIAALKAASKGMPNTLLRELQSVHANTTFADLPKELQESITTSTRAAFTQLLREGYAVAPPQPGERHRPLDRVPERDRRGPPPDRRPRRHNGPPKGPDGTGPGKGPRRPRPPKGKPRLS